MATKTISIEIDAYEFLVRKLKDPQGVLLTRHPPCALGAICTYCRRFAKLVHMRG